MGLAEPIVISLALTLVHVLGQRFARGIERFHDEITSFSAGVFITFIVLEILPTINFGTRIVGDNIFLTMLVGFAFFHIAEKYVYQHVKNKKELMKDLAHMHVAGFIVDHFIVGFTLVLFFSSFFESSNLGYIIVIPFFLHAVSSALTLEHIHEKFESGILEKLLLSLSTVYGTLTGIVLNLRPELFFLSFGFVVGVLLYVVVRDMIPVDKEGKPQYFLVGIILMILLISLGKFG